MSVLYLVRGLPGSGKSTFAHIGLPDTCCCYEADSFFVNYDNDYNWSSNFLHEAHTLCRMNTIRALYHNYNVAVANTFTTLKELQPYLDLKTRFPGLKIVVYEMKTQYESTHDVPKEAITRIKSRWQELPKSSDYEVIRIKE